MTAPSPQPKIKAPWSPTQIAWVCILFGAVPATILWAINNRRLSAVQPTVTRFLVWASLFVYSVTFLRFLGAEPDSAEAGRFRGFCLLMTLVVAWQIYNSQRLAFAGYQQEGGKTAKFGVPFTIGILCAALTIGCALGVDAWRTERDYNEFDRVAEQMQKNRAAPPQAEKFFVDFKRKYPDEPQTYLNLAWIYDQTNHPDQVKSELKQLLKLDPQNSDARKYLSEIEEFDGK